MDKNRETAIFAGGCFWCLQASFEKLRGVEKVTSGYTGGSVPNPTYEQVCSGTTGHREAVQIIFDPQKVSYETLLDLFWRQIDPTDPGGQFADRGHQYSPAIYYRDERQKVAAAESKQQLQNSATFQKPLATDIVPAAEFFPAEEYHQDYHKKNPSRYSLYKKGSGREDFLQKRNRG